MNRRFSISAYIIFGLIAIGILASILDSLSSYLIPIAVFGIIFLLYKFPLSRWSGGNKGARKTSSYKVNSREKKKPSPFRVIQGNKNLSDDDPPKYH